MPPLDPVSALYLRHLSELGLKPVHIPSGTIGGLRGGRCFDLKAGGDIDSAIARTKTGLEGIYTGVKRVEYQVEYALRGTVKGFLSNRVLALTVPRFEGLLRRRLVAFRWEMPLRGERDDVLFYLRRVKGRPMGPGEIWEGGPHQALIEALRGDEAIKGGISSLMKVYRESPLNLFILADRWGESLRVSSGIWLSEGDLPSLYFNHSYLDIVQRIFRHIKDIRRKYGGLTF